MWDLLDQAQILQLFRTLLWVHSYSKISYTYLLPDIYLTMTMHHQYPFMFVADDAFALSKNVLVPCMKKNLNVLRRIYNYRHTRARRMVECTFGILANKWRIFHRPLDVNL
nr:unnamed protein product [Callosobruchus analis]